MNDARVFVTVLGFKRTFDAFLDAPDPHDRQERHHLFLFHKRMFRVRLRKKQLRSGRKIHTCRFREHGRVSADEILVDRGVGATAALPFLERERRLGQRIKLRVGQPHRAVLFHFGHELVSDAFEREHFLFADAEQIIVESRALNDGLGRAFHARSVVHEHRRVAGAGANRTLAGLHRGLHHQGTTRDEQQPHRFVFANRGKTVQRRFLDDARDVFNAGLAVNRLVVGAHGNGGAFGRARMRIEHDRIPGGGNVHDVAAHRGNRMRAGRHRTDNAERRVFLQRDAVIAAAGIRPEPVHAGNELDDLEFRDFVVEPADFRLVEFELAPGLGVLFGERLDDFLNLAAGGDTLFFKL